MHSRVQLQNEACTLRVAFVQRQAAVHADGHQGTDGQAQSVALRQVLDFAEWLEEFGVLPFGNAAASVRHDELVGVCAAFLEVERHQAYYAWFGYTSTQNEKAQRKCSGCC